MKKIIFPILALLLIAGSSCQEKSSQLEGAWQLVYFKSITDGSVVNEYPGSFTGNQIKMWSQDHVMFVRHFEVDTTVITGGSTGTYKFEKGHYEENFIDITTMNFTEDGQYTLLLEIRNDTLIQKWPANDNWEIDQSNYMVEKYIRLK